jgi:hypothetical protein
MLVNSETTVREIVEKYPETVAIFEQHGVDVPLECAESILDTELSICEGMCHIDDIDGLIKDLQAFFDGR